MHHITMLDESWDEDEAYSQMLQDSWNEAAACAQMDYDQKRKDSSSIREGEKELRPGAQNEHVPF